MTFIDYIVDWAQRMGLPPPSRRIEDSDYPDGSSAHLEWQLPNDLYWDVDVFADHAELMTRDAAGNFDHFRIEAKR